MSWEPSPLEIKRLEKLARFEDEFGINPYPLRVERTHTTAEAKADFPEEENAEPIIVTVCGRLMSMRDMGKTVFAHVEDGYGRIQLFLRRGEVEEDSHRMFRKLLDLGDFVQATGALFRTRAGEISVRVTEWKVLSKSISPLPVAKEQEVDGETVRYSGFSNVEERYRQRYADLAVNPEVRDLFKIRAKIISSIRRFFDDHDFMEVETPILQPLYGGAAARPFVTHHNQLKQDLYLRISFELYLKRLLVGGIERVYEIGRDFRNEGVSFKHNPEFTMIEFYAAYWDYHDVMDFTERMLIEVAEQVLGKTTLTYGEHEIDLAGPWPRISMRDAIKQHAEIDYMDHLDADSLAKVVKEIGGHVTPGASWGKLIDGLFGDYVEPNLIQPTIITTYPRDISPLAKGIPGDPMHTERFEYFIAGMEMGNAFTELNDPVDQRRRFEELQELYAADDDESNPIDEDYIRAMRYGMPPNGGFGAGIDRMVMLFTNKNTIREVLLFPHLREKE
ncbi:MAG: lysine--tRNA ligase [Chloroflexota bacterium]